MDCRDVNELAVARLTGEAGERARGELSAHLATCEGCRGQMRLLESAWARLGEDPVAALRPEFRRRTLAMLDEEMLRQRVRVFRPKPRWIAPMLQAAALLLAAGLGYFAARAAQAPAASAAAPRAAAPVAAQLPDLQTIPKLSNVSYQTADKDGRVGIGFDVTTRHSVVGRPDEPEVAKLLAYLVSHNAETAGERSRAIELVSDYAGSRNAPASPEILAALSQTLRKDPNPGVRKKAADALAGFPMSPEIRTVFLEALRADKNPAVRLVAVDALAASAKETPDAHTIESLREKAVDPQENGYVRAKAASALKAISF
ncbi:MAG: HEAT repeat domain-containing protein [Acidobacteriota bacterium]